MLKSFNKLLYVSNIAYPVSNTDDDSNVNVKTHVYYSVSYQSCLKAAGSVIKFDGSEGVRVLLCYLHCLQ